MKTQALSLKIVLFAFYLMSVSLEAATTVKIVNLNAYDLVYDPFSQRIFTSVQSNDPKYPNSIVFIDPVTGTIEGSTYMGSEPRKMAISGDGRYIYTALDVSAKVRRFNVSTRTADIEFALGSGSFGPHYAEDIAVQPGNADVVAVSLYRKGVSPRHGGVAIYDNGIMRPNKTPDHTGSNVIEFSDSPDVLYGYNNETTDFGLRTMVVNEFGVTTTAANGGLISGFGVDIEYGGGYICSTTGRVIDAAAMQLAGTFSGASGPLELDAQIRRAFYISGSTIKAYNLQTFASTGQAALSGVSGSPRNLIRWGLHGLAFCTSGNQVVIVETDLVVDPPTLTNLVIEGTDHVSAFMAQYKLIADFSDGVTKDVTTQAAWSCEPNTFVSIDGSGFMFIFGTDQPGTVTLHAEYIWAETLYERTKEVSYEGGAPTNANLVRLEIQGPDRVLKLTDAQYKAVGFFDDATQFDVTEHSIWSLSTQEFAQINQTGLLSVADLNIPRDLVIQASYGHKTVTKNAVKNVTCVTTNTEFSAADWPMFQADAQHTGYKAVLLDPCDFALRWQKDIGSGRSLNPVTAADGRVFVSLYIYFNSLPQFFALDARDGEVLWSKNFGSIYSVNPPSYAYGNTYIQTGNHGSDTWLYAFDANTGAQVFKSAHSAQWERYFAPTIYDGCVYVNGGYYGGMYGFNAFTGMQLWFLGLNQYDQWTPAANGQYVFAYIGESCSGCSNAGLNVADRHNGTLLYRIPDTGFDWNGWSMNLAPVVGGFDDVLVINSGRLICFDLSERSIKWQVAGGFMGQPSVAKGIIYAINNGSLEARDEADGHLLWSWNPPEGALSGTMIITDSHVLAHTGSNTYAVEMLSHDYIWSYPASGHLALGNETLYIAAGNGILTAIATPEYIPSTPVRIEIQGPSEIIESSTTSYTAIVYYSDGRVRNRTAVSSWKLSGSHPAAAIDCGILSVGQLLYPEDKVTIIAEYTEGQTSIAAQKEVTIHISGSVCELVTRNLEDALKLKQQIMLDLQRALARERASADIIKNAHHDLCGIDHRGLNKALIRTLLAIVHETVSEKNVQKSIDNIIAALEKFSENSPYLEDMNNFRELLYPPAQQPVRNADLNNDGIVNMLDIAEMCKSWLMEPQSINF